MNLSEYKRRHRNESVTKPIRDRWASRIATNGWCGAGRQGVALYLLRYGRNIGAKKCRKIAILANTKGYHEFAEGFWEKAYKIDYPDLPFHSMDMVDTDSSAAGLPDIFHT